jgi:deazaflavin-dependent oxidoreductase (nitroreductase family)
MGEQPRVANRALLPNRVVRLGRRVFGRVLRRAGVTAVLEVPGRRTGKPVRTTLAPWEVDGARYLMSQYGPTEWVRNLRAAGGGELRYKDRTEAFRAIEVEGEERDRVIGAFRAKADRFLNRDFDRLPDAADHPTFRVSPIR